MGYYSRLALAIAEQGPAEHSERWENFGYVPKAQALVAPDMVHADPHPATHTKITCRKCGTATVVPSNVLICSFLIEHSDHGLNYFVFSNGYNGDASDLSPRL